MKLTAKHVAWVLSLLVEKPISELRNETGLSYSTLFKLLKLHLD